MGQIKCCKGIQSVHYLSEELSQHGLGLVTSISILGIYAGFCGSHTSAAYVILSLTDAARALTSRASLSELKCAGGSSMGEVLRCESATGLTF